MLRQFALFVFAMALVLATIVPAVDAHSYQRSLYDNNSNAPSDMSLFERCKSLFDLSNARRVAGVMRRRVQGSHLLIAD